MEALATLSVILLFFFSSTAVGGFNIAPSPVMGLPESWIYTGCYVDDAHDRVLATKFPDTTNLTVETCVAMCAAENMNVSGLKAGIQCFCGNEISNSSMLSKDQYDCNISCSGNTSQVCGAEDRLSVYSRIKDIVAPGEQPKPSLYWNTPQRRDNTLPFTLGNGILVTVRGPGKLHLLSYASNANINNVYGFMETTSQGIGHIIISHSYTYTKYAFYWEGSGSANWRVGPDTNPTPLGNGWDQAAGCDYGGPVVSPVSIDPSLFTGASLRDNEITAFLLPDYLVEIVT